MTKIVTIGGGTGTHVVLSGLKKYPFELSAVVTVADSGGSTGRLRDEFGDLPVGDFRMALTALAEDEEADVLRRLFLYRFEKGSGLKGHNFGNLLLVALADILGSQEKAVQYAARILDVRGNIFPITSKPVDLCAEYEDGEVTKGEADIDDPEDGKNGKRKIVKLWIEPDAVINKDTAQELLDAEYIILGPGDLYTSIFPNLVVKGTKAAIKKSKAKILYILNFVTKYGQTYGFTAKDHIEEIAKYLGRYPDFVLVNNKKFPKEILERYAEENGFPVEDDLDASNSYEIIRSNLLVPRKIERKAGDTVKRSLLRHDPDRLAWEIVKIIKERDIQADIA